MNIQFTTNIDLYKSVSWPVLTGMIPAKGSFIHVHPGSVSYCEDRKIPTQLEVVGITYHYDRVVVDLWYNDTDYKLYTLNGTKLL